MSKTAFLFPGQGAQVPGMGEDFYQQYPAAREVFDLASETVKLDMVRLCSGEDGRLDLTEYTQIALLTASLAIERVLRGEGVSPDVTAGLSLGEYCAIVSAGAMEHAGAMRAVRERGILMQRACPPGEGAMAAVLGLAVPVAEAVIAGIDGAYIANDNCPGQLVVSGRTAAVEKAGAAMLAAGARRVVPLKVSGPFHSPLMEPAARGLEEVLSGIPVRDPAVPYVSNVTAEYVREASRIRPLLVRQVTAGVRWRQSVETMLADGVDTFVEIGPGHTLTGFVRKIRRDAVCFCVRTCGELRQVCEALA